MLDLAIEVTAWLVITLARVTVWRLAGTLRLLAAGTVWLCRVLFRAATPRLARATALILHPGHAAGATAGRAALRGAGRPIAQGLRIRRAVAHPSAPLADLAVRAARPAGHRR